MSMNAKDIITIIDYMKVFNKPDKLAKKLPKDKKMSGTKSLIKSIEEREEELEYLKKYLKDKEKLNKKDEDKKKEEKSMRALTFAEGVVLAYVAQFLLGPLYNHYITLLQVH